MAKKNPCRGKHREFGNFAKTQGILFAQVVNSLILKVEDIAIFAAKISIFSRSWIVLPTQFCVCDSHKSCKLAQGKFADGQGKHREFENTILVGTLNRLITEMLSTIVCLYISSSFLGIATPIM